MVTLALDHRDRPRDDLTSSGKVHDTVVAFTIGAAIMTVAGIVAAFLAVDAERKSLEDIAEPLSTARASTSTVPASV